LSLLTFGCPTYDVTILLKVWCLVRKNVKILSSKYNDIIVTKIGANT